MSERLTISAATPFLPSGNLPRNAGFGVILLIAVTAIFSFRSLTGLSDAYEQADRAQQAQHALDHLLSSVEAAVADERDYLVTGDDFFLAAYGDDVKSVRDGMARVPPLIAGNADQQRRLEALGPRIERRLALLDENIELRKSQGMAAAVAALAQMRGRDVMSQVRGGISDMIREELQVSGARAETVKERARSWAYLLVIEAVGSVAIIGFVLYLMIREARRRESAERDLLHANTALESRVSARTAELEAEIAERRKTEEDLKSTRNFLDIVIENIPGMLSVKDARDSTFLLFNRAGEELLGYDRSELIGKSDYDFFPKEQADFFVGRDREVVKSGKPHFIPEEYITTRHRGVRLLKSTKVPVPDSEGRPQYLLVFSEDITEHKATEQQLRQAMKMEAVGQLTGGIAHDFNNLLGVIIGNLDLLIDRQGLDPKEKELAHSAIEGALRGAELTQRLLAFSRKQALQPQIIDVNERLPQIAGMLRRTLGEQIAVAIKPQAGLWSAVADRTQIEEAILNLAINARDAMPKGGVLTIETANVRLDEDYAAQQADLTPGEYVMLAVSDTGTGMTADVLERAFDPFFTTKGADKGTGLGLSMVYGFVKQSNGHIKIYSEVGHGTSIKIYLPRADRDAAAEAQSSLSEATPTRGHELILLVEDNEGMRNVAARQLGDLGYRTLEAENGKSALAVLAAHPEIDLVFSDVVMPGGMTGYDLAREVRRLHPRLRILLTSGFTSQSLTNGFHDDEGLELLHKPYRKADLARKLRELLDRPD